GVKHCAPHHHPKSLGSGPVFFPRGGASPPRRSLSLRAPLSSRACPIVHAFGQGRDTAVVPPGKAPPLSFLRGCFGGGTKHPSAQARKGANAFRTTFPR